MRLQLKDFPTKSLDSTRFQMRYVNHSNAWKVVAHDRYWTLPLLLRLMAEVERVAPGSPAKAAALADPLSELARRIPVRDEPEFFSTDREKRSFEALAGMTRCSALASVGQLDEASTESAKWRRSMDGIEPFVQAEVLRRSSYVALAGGEFERAGEYAREAASRFSCLPAEFSDYHALAHLYIGLADHYQKPGAGTVEFCRTIYIAARVKTECADRAIDAAFANLSRTALLENADAHTMYTWISAAKERMKGRSWTIPKLKVRWTEAILAYRIGWDRYGEAWLERVRDQMIRLGSFVDAVCCTADLLHIVKQSDPGRLAECAQRSYEALRGATSDERTLRSLEAWAERPSDVALLRDVVRRRSADEPTTSH